MSLHLDFNSRSTRRRCLARCSEGDLTWDAINDKIIWQPADSPEEVENFVHYRDENYLTQLQYFFDCMENKNTPAVSVEDGSDVLRIVEAARESSAKRKTVTLV